MTNGSDTLVYVGCKDGYIYRFRCFDGFSGTNNNWKVFTGAPINKTSPIIDNNKIVYISSSSGNLYGYNYKFLFNSQPKKRFYQNYGINGTPGIGPDGTIFIGCDNGKFFALNRGDSSVIDMPVKWYMKNTGPVVAPTLVTDQGWVFIGNSTGDIYFMVDPSVNPKNNALASEQFYYWPTFKGNNLRTGNFKNMPLNVNIRKIENTSPDEFKLYQNYPNPFNSQTIIKFDLPKFGSVIIQIYDAAGKEVFKLIKEKLEAGSYFVECNFNNYPSGVYFYRFKTGEINDTKRMVLIK
jgi:hypothetical protein